MTADPSRTRWPLVALAIACGVLGGLQVGKVPPAIPLLRDELGLGLVTAGWVASLFNVAGAGLGALTGLASDRVDPRRLLLGCIALLGLGGLAGGFAQDATQMLLSRAVESFGFVGVVVGAPRLIVAATRPADRQLALGIWGSYMPTGMAAAMLAAPFAFDGVGWRGLWFAGAALCLALLGVLWAVTAGGRWPRVPAEPRSARDLVALLARPGPWLLAACFTLYSLQWFAVASWLPTMLIEQQGASTAEAARTGAWVVAINILGNVGAAWLLHRGVPRLRLIVTAYLAMALGGVGLYAGIAPAALGVPFALMFSMVGGLLPASVLAAVPAHAPTPSQIATGNGIVVQGANTGSLLGPPVTAALVAWSGSWESTWMLLAACGSLGIVLAATASRLERPV